MVFTSFNFLIFFPLLIVIYYFTPKNVRWFTLLLASYFFYINMQPIYVLLVILVTLCTYYFARRIDEVKEESKKKRYMIINIVLILLPLFFFKYYNNINNSIFLLLETIHIRWPLPQIKLMLPIGISYYTFMAIGYTLDVYNEEIKAEKHIGILALFISFFPLILSGPIERAGNIIPQLKSKSVFNYNMFVKGLKLMLWGYFMKLVVADRIGIYVDAVFTNIPHHNGTTLSFASILYSFQLYGDLGGYSLIAIGTAKVLGINVIHNFKRPFFATSMSEFWRRWHISLISWLTDYIYTPLSFAFRKYKIWGIVIAIMLTFLISGIWHGAAMTFVVWGIMQGVFLSIEALTKNKKSIIESKFNLKKKTWYNFINIILTFILFSASALLYRIANFKEVFIVFNKIITSTGSLFIGAPSTLIYGGLGILMILIKDFNDEYLSEKFLFFNNKNKLVRVLSYSSIIILILLIGVFDGGQFIYFQF